MAKQRYVGRYQGGILNLDAVQDVVSEVQAKSGHSAGSRSLGKPRYRGQFVKGTLRIKPTQPPPPGRLSPVENSVLSGLGNQERGGQVPITYFPTKTSNPDDPRTAAAGYDRDTQTLRVEFGDGGPAYNYYQVTPAEWRSFQRVNSPGRYINRVLNYHPYGPA